VRVGKEYRQAMLKRYGNVPQMWAAYNAGPGRVDAARQFGADWINHVPAETRNYVNRNMRALRGY
jgi:soluble lytic murein transglycosylase-like protein